MKVFVGLFILILSFTVAVVNVCSADEVFEESPFGAAVSTSISSNFQKRHRRVYTDVDAKGSYFWPNSSNGEIESSLSLGLIKLLTQDMKLLLKDLTIETAHNELYVHPKTDIVIRGYGKLFLPTSQESQNRSQVTVIKLGTGASKNIAQWYLGYDLSGSYFFNQYRIAKNRTANQQYGVTNTAIIGYQFTKELSLNTLWSLLNFATYAKTPRASFSFVQEASFKMTPQLSASLGLATGGRQYKNNGKELNLSLFDDKGSEVFFGVGYEF